MLRKGGFGPGQGQGECATGARTADSTSYSQSIVDIALSTKAKTTVAIANSCAPQPNYAQASYQTGSPESIEKAWQNSDNTNPCYYECTGAYT